jgi:peptidyl-prolyl cis-trans isomerase C
VVVRVGPEVARVSDVSRRFAGMPPYQLAGLAQGADAKRRFVDGVLVPEMLYGAEGARRNVMSAPAVARRVLDAKRRALVESIRRELADKGIPDAELKAYYDAHASDYRRPERLRLLRILVADEATAKKIIGEARGPGGPQHWATLARESSVDEATKMRSGSLGFVQPDGHTEVPQLAVDPALYAAAAKVRDGDVVPNPVREGDRFAVVWRRGTLPKLDRSFDVERPAITALLLRERTDHAVQGLLEDLRKAQLHDENVALLELLPVEPPTHPPVDRLSKTVRSVDPAPSAGERGLR